MHGSFAPVQNKSVYDRLLQTAKRLFAAQGVENTTTAVIARESGTSESQLVKYFQSKEGLLQAIFEDGWQRLGFIYMAASIAEAPEEKLRIIFELLIKALSEDPDLRYLFLLEGRRVRHKSSEVLITDGYHRLMKEVEALTTAVLAKSPRTQKITPRGLASGLVGTIESMLRDQTLTERRTGKAEPSAEEVREMFHLMLQAVTK